MVISTQKPTSVHCDYYNIQFLDLDHDDDGVFLEPGSYWTFGIPTPIDQLPQGGEEPNPEDEPNLEEEQSTVLAPPSRDLSSAPSADRVETGPDLCDPLASFTPNWQSSRVQELDPSSPLVYNSVYWVPSLPGNLISASKIDKKF